MTYGGDGVIERKEQTVLLFPDQADLFGWIDSLRMLLETKEQSCNIIFSPAARDTAMKAIGVNHDV